MTVELTRAQAVAIIGTSGGMLMDSGTALMHFINLRGINTYIRATNKIRSRFGYVCINEWTKEDIADAGYVRSQEFH